MNSKIPLSIQSTITLNSGEKIPILGFGVWNSVDALNSCKTAIKVGYRHIDSARLYGNEAQVVEAVKSSNLARQSIYLTTKVGSKEHGLEECKAAIEDSTTPPKPDYWDLFLLHDPLGGAEKRINAYRTLVEAQKSGKTKTIGVSNFGVTHLIELEKANVGPIPAINQLEIHPWCQQREIVEYCRSKGIILQAYCPLVRGKYMSDPILVKISQKYHKTPAQILIRWSLQNGFIPLPKSDNNERIKENSNVFDFELDEQSMKELDELDLGDLGAISWNPIHAI